MLTGLWRTLPLLLVLTPAAGHAEDMTFSDVVQDAKLYVTSPIRWDTKDWMYFGGTIAAIAAAHQYDSNVREHFTHNDPAALNGKDPHSTRDALPAAALVLGTWTFATLTGSSQGHVEAYTMLEAAAFSAVTTEAVKFAAGRARPNETTKVDSWRQSGSSFPSLHATAAFAIGTVLAESGNDEYRWFRRALGYGVATATAYLRVKDNAHWLSDTVAGAAIGIATARFAMNRRDQRAHKWDMSVAPAEGGGVMVGFNLNMD